MRRQHRRLGQHRRLQRALLRDVRDVDQHAEPVQLGDRRAAELGQSAMQRLGVAEVGPRIAAVGERVVAVMGEREIARALGAELREQAEILADRMAVLDARG